MTLKCAVLASGLALAAWVPVCAAQGGGVQGGGAASGAVQKLNEGAAVPGTKDASAVLFPAIAAMEAPPAKLSILEVSLLTSGDDAFAPWAAWAAGEKQQAVIAALATVTDPKTKHSIGFKYGQGAVDSTWVKPGLYVELGKPELLASAIGGMKYLEALDRVALLVTAEAERQINLKKAKESSEVILDWVRLGRMMADRPFAPEKIWGMTTMIAGLERLRDIACQHSELFGEEVVKSAVDELDPRTIETERIRFPSGERQALVQLIELTTEERGGPNSAFGATMATVVSAGKPLDRFRIAGHWATIAKGHAGRFELTDQVNKVFGDWEQRWDIDNIFDRLLQNPTDYSKMDVGKFAMIEQVVKGMETLFELRTEVRVQLAGTRAALGVVGFHQRQQQWPPVLESVQPRFVTKLDTDPWYFEPTREVRLPLRYFVPMRDQKLAERELPKPHEILVHPAAGGEAPAPAAPPAEPAAAPEPAKDSPLAAPGKPATDAAPKDAAAPAPAPAPAPAAQGDATSSAASAALRAIADAMGIKTFTASIDQSRFILYSVGPDGKAQFARKVGLGGDDLLLWPPLLTLLREERLREKESPEPAAAEKPAAGG